ncbi:MAG TPA: FAD-dependent oxidoreductase [Longimicrobiales bacterium]
MHELRAEVVVIGAGPAGIAAASVAAEGGRSTLLIDEAHAPGGQVWRAGRTRAARKAREWRARLERSGARTVTSATVIDVESPLSLIGEREGRPVRIAADAALVLAVGARELFLPFPGWTLPNVIGAGGAQALLKSGWSVRGLRIVVAGSGPLLLPVAAALAASGARVRAVAEQAPAAAVGRFALGLWRSPGRALDAALYRAAFARARYRTGTWVARASGDSRLGEVVLTDGSLTRTLACDVLCIGYGLVPAVELPLLVGCELREGGVAVDALQRTSVDHVYCAGEVTGIAGRDAALVQGSIAGLAASGRGAETNDLLAARDRHAAFARRVAEHFGLRAEIARLAEDDTIVCRCEDVTHDALAACTSLREAKLTTRAGMGACQGRVCGSTLRHIHAWQRDNVRPPLTPTTIGTLSAATPREDPA